MPNNRASEMNVEQGPAYARVQKYIHALIEEGKLAGNSLVPAERELASILELSRSTVRYAMDELVSKGVLVRLPRKGTIVSPKIAVRSTQRCFAAVVPLMDYATPNFVVAIEQAAIAKDISIITVCSNKQIPQEEPQIRAAIDRGAEAIFLFPASDPSGTARASDTFDYLVDLPVPVVLMDSLVGSHSCTGMDCVLSDNFAGGYAATRHLIETGRRTISIIDTMAKEPIFQERFAGYKAALEEEGLSIPTVMPLRTNDLKIPKSDRILQALNAGVDAFFATNDSSAVLLLNRLREIDASVPDDVAVIGYDDEPYGQLMEPALSSVRVNACEMARWALKFIEHRLETENDIGKQRVVCIPPRVIARASTGFSVSASLPK